VRRRLVLAIAGVATVGVIMFAVPLAIVLERAYLNEELLRLQRDTVAATRGVDVATTPGDPIELPDEASLAVYATDGERIAGRGGPRTADDVVAAVLHEQAPSALARDGRLIAAAPLVDDERITGVVRGERAATEATRLTRSGYVLLIGLAAGVVLLAVVAALALGRHLARPLERLAAAARRLGEGDFSVRAPRPGVRELDDVAAALENSAQRLDELVQRERAFSANASHQLRTPLAAVRIELEALELRGAGTPELRAALSQVDRLQDTIDTLLAVARDAPRSAAGTPLRAVVEELEARWRAPLARTDRRLDVRIDDPRVAVPAPAPVLREILDVLLENAMLHGAGTVRVHARRTDGSLAVDVADEGPGVAGEAEELFARRSSAAGGHGIGLALARSLAEAEGGALVLGRPAPPVFTLLVPLVS
jgi:signal transduction histidine kinase